MSRCVSETSRRPRRTAKFEKVPTVNKRSDFELHLEFWILEMKIEQAKDLKECTISSPIDGEGAITRGNDENSNRRGGSGGGSRVR